MTSWTWSIGVSREVDPYLDAPDPSGREGKMAGWLMKIITAEARRLIALAAEDTDLRADLRALAEEILAATEEPLHPGEVAPTESTSGADPSSESEEGASSSLTTLEVAQDERAEATEPLRELTLGRSRSSPVTTE